MKRRDFLKYGAAGAALAGAGLSSRGALGQTCEPCVFGGTTTPTARFDLRIRGVTTDMIDGTKLNMLGFGLDGGSGSGSTRVPGPVLRVKEGTRVQITIANDVKQSHRFEITGIYGSKTEIAPGCTCTVSFTAPMAGTYIYHDSSVLYRILGLHGVLVVEPSAGNTAAGSGTPYSFDKLDALQQTAIGAVFDAFGTHERFPGGKWVPAPSDQEFSLQEKIWVCSSVDPKFNALLGADGQITSSSITGDVVGNFLPRYFTINNRSGYDLHSDKSGQLACVPRNYIGEPTLIRVVNVGLCHHANHIHGNHPFDLSRADLDPLSPTHGQLLVSDNIREVDTWAMWPMQRRDVLLQYEVPPDIPFKIPFGNPDPAMVQFDRMVAGKAQEPFPLRYVMHCHTEMSQTAAGGNYPQGMVTHWEILGGVGGRAKATSTLASR